MRGRVRIRVAETVLRLNAAGGSRALISVFVVVVIFIVAVAIIVAVIISAWPSQWCSYGKLFPCGAGDLPKETCSREPLRREDVPGAWWSTWGFPKDRLGRRRDEFTRPRILVSADAWINDSRRRRDPKSSTKLPGFTDPRTPRIVERDDRIDGCYDFIRL